MTLRHTRRRSGADEDLSRPSRWRLQHGGVEEVAVMDGARGKPVAARRAVDTLGAMLANGTITPAMHEAGETFRWAFRRAALDPLRATPLLRLPRSTDGSVADHQLDARQRVAAALEALGGADSAAGSCVWHVVGCECSLREWATRQGWGGRSVGHTQAQGMLVAALGVLAGHYRLVRR